MDLLEDYLTLKELAAALGCSERTIARYKNAPNGLPYVLLGGRLLFRKDAVRTWIASKEKKPNPCRRAA